MLAGGTAIKDIAAAAVARLTAQQVRDYWFQGGYPEPWLSGSEEFRSLWYRHYIDAYLLRDIGALFPNLNRDRYRQFIAMLSQFSGNILNNADIARMLGISEPTVRDWLNIAHDTFLWRHIPAWDRSSAKQLVKHPKGFLRSVVCCIAYCESRISTCLPPILRSGNRGREWWWKPCCGGLRTPALT